MVIGIATDVKAKNLTELVHLAKKSPGKINLGSAGMGTQVHMAGENFSYAADIDMTHVPYRGEAAAYTDLMAGQVDVVVGNIGAATPLSQDGRITALAVTGNKRALMLPDVPTAEEAGLKGFENYGWFGFVVPAGTPDDVVDKIQKDTATVLQMPKIRERLAQLGMEPVGNKPDEFKKDIDEESRRWEKVIKERNITMQQ